MSKRLNRSDHALSAPAADGFDPAEGRPGSPQGPKALAETKETFHGCVIALDEVVPPLFIDVSDAVKVRIISMIDLANDTSTSGDFISADRHWPMQSYTLDRLVQQSRVALARVLVQGKPLLLLDEPFAALGPALRAEMLDLTSGLARATGATVLMITHAPEDAERVADQVLFVDEGRVDAPRAVTGIMANPPEALRAYLGR